MKYFWALATVLALANCGGGDEGSGSSDQSDPILGVGIPGSVSTVPTN
jgi:hypothetical protein